MTERVNNRDDGVNRRTARVVPRTFSYRNELEAGCLGVNSPRPSIFILSTRVESRA